MYVYINLLLHRHMNCNNKTEHLKISILLEIFVSFELFNFDDSYLNSFFTYFLT